MRSLLRLPEPTLLFRHGQEMEDPRDGLTLFGPLDTGKPYGIRSGVIGTKGGIEKFKRWLEWSQGPIRPAVPQLARPPFPGFESAFRIPWSPEPVQVLEIDEDELKQKLYLDDRHQRVFGTVNLYAEPIIKALQEEEAKPDVWFVVIPDDVRKYCRPEAVIDPDVRLEARRRFSSVREAKSLYRAPSLFEEQNEAAEPYFYKEHFRNQLKARLLPHKISTQVLREGTMENVKATGETSVEKALIKMQSAIAWNISTTAFYKAGGRPWKVSGIRDGVCYIGLVYKKDDRAGDNKTACCGAQMFLDSGDGVVFKGAVGPWYHENTRDYHLSREAAMALIALALQSYKDKNNGRAPSELFIHGQTMFYREEWSGFEAATESGTNLVGVKIRDDASLKLFRKADTPVLRGIAYARDERNAFLWTRGWTPRLQTYVGREVPNPLTIEICQGSAPIETVLRDILALTKLNYNTCILGDGKPITLKFADAVGEVLTVGPVGGELPLPFMYYI
jgi:hypothetical protein